MTDTTGLARLGELFPRPAKAEWLWFYIPAMAALAWAWFCLRHPTVGAAFLTVCAVRLWVVGSWTAALWVCAAAIVAAAACAVLAGGVSPKVRGRLRAAYWLRQRRHLVDSRWATAAQAAGLQRTTPDGPVRPPIRVGYADRDRVVANVTDIGVGGKTATDLVKAAPNIAAVYQARACRVIARSEHEASVTLFFGPDPLAHNIPLGALPAATKPWHATPGVTEGGPPIQVDIRKSLLLGGMSGSGKSTCVWALLDGIVRERISVRLWVADPKGGMELNALKPVAWRYEDSTKGCTAMILEAFEAMEVKQKRLAAAGVREHLPTVEEPADLVIVDETLALGKETRKDENAPLAQIAFRGRASAFSMWLAAQAGDLRTLGVVRGFTPQRMCFRSERPEMTNAILDTNAESKGAPCTQIRDTEAGVGFMYQEDAQGFVRFKIAHVPDAALPGIVAGLRRLAVFPVEDEIEEHPAEPVARPRRQRRVYAERADPEIHLSEEGAA